MQVGRAAVKPRGRIKKKVSGRFRPEHKTKRVRTQRTQSQNKHGGETTSAPSCRYHTRHTLPTPLSLFPFTWREGVRTRGHFENDGAIETTLAVYCTASMRRVDIEDTDCSTETVRVVPAPHGADRKHMFRSPFSKQSVSSHTHASRRFREATNGPRKHTTLVQTTIQLQ